MSNLLNRLDKVLELPTRPNVMGPQMIKIVQAMREVVAVANSIHHCTCDYDPCPVAEAMSSLKAAVKLMEGEK